MRDRPVDRLKSGSILAFALQSAGIFLTAVMHLVLARLVPAGQLRDLEEVLEPFCR